MSIRLLLVAGYLAGQTALAAHIHAPRQPRHQAKTSVQPPQSQDDDCKLCKLCALARCGESSLAVPAFALVPVSGSPAAFAAAPGRDSRGAAVARAPPAA